MHRVRLFHWRADEAKPLIAALRAGGYTVDYPGDKANGSWRSLRENSPYAAIIDLTRLPSHGRYVGAEIRATKSLRHIPIVFVDGDPEKVESIRKDLPDAVYTSRSRLVPALKRVKPLADPVIAPRMMDRTDRTTAEKLGIKTGDSTPDGRIYLKREEECLAACCGAPMMMVDHVFHENLTPQVIDKVLDELT